MPRDQIAKRAYSIADALIEERSIRQKKEQAAEKQS